MRVLVVGAGVMGSASALELAAADPRVEVVLLERAVPGAEASSAAAGMLGAQLESHDARELAFYTQARERYRAWAEALRDATGVDIGHRVSGALRIATNDDEAHSLAAVVRAQTAAGARAELLDAHGARAIEPLLGDGVVAAAHYPDEAQVDPPKLLRALAVAVARHPRITLKSGATVERVLVENGRAVGVRLEDGELRGDVVVLAAGSWSSLVGGVERALPSGAVRPARGQLLQLEERPPRLRCILAGAGAYVVPRGDGRVVCGSTVEFVGFRREVTAGGIHRILGGAIALVPSLEAAELGPTWSSFRPYSTAESPLVGTSAIPGLVLATGHHRNGILLAKITAEAVRDAVFAG